MHHDDPAYQEALAAVPAGACTMLIRYTRVQVRVPETGEFRTVEFDEFDVGREAALTQLMMRQLHNGMADLRDLPEHFFRHPDCHCPACEEAALPGPVVYGVWLPEDWYHDRAADHIQRGLVQRFANRELTETVARDRLQTLLAHRAATRDRHAVTIPSWPG